VNRFIDSILPSEAEIETGEALAEEAAGDLESAEEGYREVLERDPQNAEASIGLARILVGRGEMDAARALAEPVLPDPGAERIMSTVRVHDWGSLPGGDPIADARKAAAAGRWREALEGLLAAFDDEPDEARASMVDIFATLGEDPLVTEYRPKLAARLF
jgi:thioredoxin-like negative regulator of GroEL